MILFIVLFSWFTTFPGLWNRTRSESKFRPLQRNSRRKKREDGSVVCGVPPFFVSQIHILFGILIPLDPPPIPPLIDLVQSVERERETINDGIDHCCPARGESIDWYCLLCVSTNFWGVFSSSSSVLLLRPWWAHALSFFFFLNYSFTMLGQDYEKIISVCGIRLGSFGARSTTICKTRLPLQVLNWYTARGCNTITGTTNKHMPYFIFFFSRLKEEKKKRSGCISCGVFASFDTMNPTAWSWCSNGW